MTSVPELNDFTQLINLKVPTENRCSKDEQPYNPEIDNRCNNQHKPKLNNYKSNNMYDTECIRSCKLAFDNVSDFGSCYNICNRLQKRTNDTFLHTRVYDNIRSDESIQNHKPIK